MNDDLCLSIDLGTGGPKIGLVTLDGDVLGYELHTVTTTITSDGGATQDAAQWWTLITESTRRLMDRPDVTKSRVKAVAVTGQYASTVPVDANGVPTGPCLMWFDTRGREFSRRAIGGPVEGYSPRKILPFIRKSGGGPSPSGADPTGQILYLMNREPEILAATTWLMEPVDYLTMRFTRVATATHASRLAGWLTDNRHLTTFHYDDQLLKIVGIDRRNSRPCNPSAASWARWRRTWPSPSVCRATRSWSPASPTCTRRRSARARPTSTKRTSRCRPRRGSVVRCRRRRPTRCTRSPPSPASPTTRTYHR